MSALDRMSDKDRPDYTFIGMMLVTMKENIKFELNGPFDWQKACHLFSEQAFNNC